MGDTAYVYAFTATADDLERHARWLGDGYYWVADLASLQTGKGRPSDWLDYGAVFGPTGELRWRRVAHQFEACLLTLEPVAGYQPVAGNWEVREESVMLQDLCEPRVCPSFQRYPHGQPSGALTVRVYRRDGIVTWISPRAFASHDQEVGE
jgi:hypothetical protein